MFFNNRGKQNVDAILEKTKNEPELDLEKGDLKAIIIAAFLVLTPVLLIFIGAIGLVYWLFIGRF